MATRCGHVESFQRLPQLDGLSGPIELQVIACQLLNDEKALQSNGEAHISLCAKWAPTEMTHYDRKPLKFASKIAKCLGVKKTAYRKKLTALRVHINVLEQQMATQEWHEIKFESLPAKAHRLHRKAFHRDGNKKGHTDRERVAFHERYKEYLNNLKKGRTSIKSTGTQPHELVKAYIGRASDAPADLMIEGIKMSL